MGKSFTETLNTDGNSKLTSAEYDSNAGAWVNKVQVTGRNVEKKVIANAVAIVDTTPVFSDIVDLTKYKEVFIQIINTHDVDMYIQAREGSEYIKYHDGTTWKLLAVTIGNTPSNERLDITTENEFFRKNILTGNFNFKISPRGTPSSGSITIIVYGVVN